MSIEEKQIAFHEAGHVAADLLLGHNPDHATIVKKEDALGSAHQLDGDSFSVEGIEGLVISLYAGAEAEKQVTDDYESVMITASSDYEKADDYLQSLSSTKESLEQRAAKLLQEHWPLVERIAKELIEYGTLEMGELDFIFDIYRGDATENDFKEYRIRAAYLGQFNHLRGRRGSIG